MAFAALLREYGWRLNITNPCPIVKLCDNEYASWSHISIHQSMCAAGKDLLGRVAQQCADRSLMIFFDSDLNCYAVRALVLYEHRSLAGYALFCNLLAQFMA